MVWGYINAYGRKVEARLLETLLSPNFRHVPTTIEIALFFSFCHFKPDTFYYKLCLQIVENNRSHNIETWGPNSVSFVHPAGIENPAFMPDLDPMDLLQIPPWLAESELDSSMVVLSHRAQVDLPRTPSNLRRLAPLRISTHSTDSFTLENIPDTQQMDSDQLQPPPPPPRPPRDDGYM